MKFRIRSKSFCTVDIVSVERRCSTKTTNPEVVRDVSTPVDMTKSDRLDKLAVDEVLDLEWFSAHWSG